MQLRKVLNFNTILGITLPKEFTNALELEPKDYVEVSLTKAQTVVIKKHETYVPRKDLDGTKPSFASA